MTLTNFSTTKHDMTLVNLDGQSCEADVSFILDEVVHEDASVLVLGLAPL